MDIYEQRIAKFREAMATSGLDLLVFYSDAQHSFLGSDGVLYASGFKAMAPSAVLLPKDGDPALVLTPVWDEARARRASSGIERMIAANDFPAAFAGTIQQLGLGASKAGLVGARSARRSTLGFFAGLFPNGMEDFDKEFDDLTQSKDDLEIRYLREAAEIAERGYEHLLRTARPGLLEYELAAEVDMHMKELGADDDFQLMSASQHNVAVRAPGDRRLDVGDIILGEISPSVHGQFTQICRSVVIGEATPLQQEKYQLLADAMKVAMKTGVPGTPVRQVVEAMNSVISDAGYAKYCFPPYMRVRGHSMGLGSSMPGDITLDNNTALREGMSFVLHPNQYIPETGYFLVGEPVIVTGRGLEQMTKRQPALDSVPA